MEFRIKPLVKGVVSFALPSLGTSHVLEAGTLSTDSSDFCYSLFLRHLSYISQFTDGKVPRVVAEFGPGSSVGMGLAALIAGAELYYGLDIVDHTDKDRNLVIFDEFVDMFRRRTPIPSTGLHETTFPLPLAWEFPPSIGKTLDRLLESERIQSLRDDLAQRSGKHIRMATPWMTTEIVPRQSVDWLFSHAVMEHVDDLEEIYQCCSYWLHSGGMMTHLIGYNSHRITKHWNGHWAVSDLAWTLIRGKRPYLINRVPHSGHIKLIKHNNFSIEKEVHYAGDGGLPKQEFSAAFRQMSDSDSNTEMALVVSMLNRASITEEARTNS